MVKTLARSIREFKKPAILTPFLVTVEVILECIIPLIIANLVNQMQAGCSMDVIVNYGIQLLVLAVLSLIFGVAAGNTCATASTGFARNLRRDMFYCIQDYSFENIDKFSVSSLVTRMTTDVVNVQMAYHDDHPRGHPRASDAHFLLYHGLCHGRAPGHDFPGHHSFAEHWPGAGHPRGHAHFPQGVPQIRCAERFCAGKCAGYARGKKLCAGRV